MKEKETNRHDETNMITAVKMALFNPYLIFQQHFCKNNANKTV